MGIIENKLFNILSFPVWNIEIIDKKIIYLENLYIFVITGC